ncbi:hypothetical protein SUGI_0694060 [Cryptomeria japonica]|nr:hypothetical protein SUGI_0694060 [Cryptomeria japonica]
MKILSWNIGGLNGLEKCHLLKQLFEVESPDVLLIQETKMEGGQFIDLIPRIWGNSEGVAGNAIGTVCGQAIAWNKNNVLGLVAKLLNLGIFRAIPGMKRTGIGF